MTKKNYIDLIKFKKKINFGFFTKKGGVSNGEYYSLNCNRNDNDDINNVNKNIKIAIKNLGIENKKLKIINQIHSDKIISVTNKNFKKQFYGDGLITSKKEIALAVLTADCAPIFIFDIQNNFICCVHSGWKGAMLNIVGKCVQKLKKKNINTEDIVAIIGPCLGYKNFEVDKNFKLKFIEKNDLYSEYFKTKNDKKDLFDLRGIINFQLVKEGINKIHHIKRDTYKNDDIFFSHRRDTHHNKMNTGRMINIITFRD